MTVDVTVLGMVFVVAALVAVALRRDIYLWVVSAAAAFPTSAAVVLNDDYSVSPFHLLGIPLVAALALSPKRFVGPGGTTLLLFLAWTGFVTITAPVLHASVRVLEPDRGIEGALAAPQPLAFTASQVAQLTYLVIGVALIFVVARRRISVLLPGVGLALAVLLAFSEYVAVQLGRAWPHDFFDTSDAAYLDSAYLGQVRIRGPFAEASLLGEVSVAAVAYFALLAVRYKGGTRLAGIGLAAISLWVAVASASGAGAVALIVAATFACIAVLARFLRRGRSAGAVLLGGPVLAAVALIYGGRLYATVSALIEDKLGSQSAYARGASNAYSLDVLRDTFGLGVGVGAHRPSSFLFMLLACTGVIGTLLFGATVWRLASADRGPAAAGLIAGLTAKVTASADLSSPYLWVLLGACAGLSWNRHEGGRGEVPGGRQDLSSSNPADRSAGQTGWMSGVPSRESDPVVRRSVPAG